MTLSQSTAARTNSQPKLTFLTIRSRATTAPDAPDEPFSEEDRFSITPEGLAALARSKRGAK